MKFTDERVRLTQEILLGIRVIKYYCWESFFTEKIASLRKKELKYLRAIGMVRGVVSAVTTTTPAFASIITFIVYKLRGGTLEPAILFSSVALFNLLRTPLNLLPSVINMFADASVALKRVGDFLTAEELVSLPTLVPDASFAVNIDHADFVWEAKPNEKVEVKKQKLQQKVFRGKAKEARQTATLATTEEANVSTAEIVSLGSGKSSLDGNPAANSTLKNININIPRGALVAIVGSVGKLYYFLPYISRLWQVFTFECVHWGN